MEAGEVTHLYTEEILYHYTCEQCGNWWSYSATPRQPSPHLFTCPHCGYHARTEKKANV